MLFQVVTENGVKKIKYLTADTGTGAPVGSIIVVCSNILPSGYIGLGVQYDITNYPALYQVLGTDTTPTASALGLPTLSSGQYAIKATSGLTENQQENVLNTINENNSYSTEEHPTGKKWIDGKPIYRKVIEVASISSGTTDVNHGADIDKLISYNGYCEIYGGKRPFPFIDDGGNSARIAIYTSTYIRVTTSYDMSNAEIVLEYTKTTD